MRDLPLPRSLRLPHSLQSPRYGIYATFPAGLDRAPLRSFAHLLKNRTLYSSVMPPVRSFFCAVSLSNGVSTGSCGAFTSSCFFRCSSPYSPCSIQTPARSCATSSACCDGIQSHSRWRTNASRASQSHPRCRTNSCGASPGNFSRKWRTLPPCSSK